ncbi:hypothetical protein CRM22_002570, partial [Opisthorchis felineus]
MVRNLSSSEQTKRQFSDSEECRICTDGSSRVTIPKGAGLPNVDTLLYIQKGKDSLCNVTIASQELCAQEHTEDRPVAAFISICPNLFKYPRRYQTDVMVHEVCHALGVSIYVYPYLRKEDGTPQTPRDPETNLPNLGMFGKDLYYSGNYTSITKNESRLTASGYVNESIYQFTLPNVVGEIMAMSVGKPLHISHFLLAFLYDTGWYHVSDAHAAAPTWGKAAGEEFLTKSCYEYVKFKRSKNQPPTPFCGWEEVNAPACLPDRSGYGLCDIVKMRPSLPLVHTVDPPEINVHYRKGHFGGPRIQFNYCPIIEQSKLTKLWHRISHVCNQEVAANNDNIALESFGGQSVCLDHDREDPWRFHSADELIDLDNYGASCHQHKCTLGKGLQLVFGNTTYACPVGGGSIKIDVTTEKGNLQGSVHCPICETLCNETVCSPSEYGDLLKESDSANKDVLHNSDAQVPTENHSEDVGHSKAMTGEEVVAEDVAKDEESDEKQMENDAVTSAPVPPTLKTESDTLGEQSNTDNTKENTMDTDEHK